MREIKRIGEILLEKQLLTNADLEFALANQAASGQRLCSYLYLNQRVSEEELVATLGEHRGIAGVALTRSIVDLSCLALIPRSIAERYSILPIRLDQDQLYLAMSDPQRGNVIDEIQFVTGTHVTAFVALKGMVDAGLRTAYATFESGRRDLLHGPLADQSCDTGLVYEVLDRDGAGVIEADDLVEVEIDIADEVPVPVVSESVPVIPSPVASDAKARILVVDDEPDILQLLRTALSKNGYDVITASRGLEALQMVKSGAPDLVLLDAMLPEIHGFEICQKIKSSQRFASVPVIMITAIYRGWRFAQDVKVTYGADDYIEKPFSIEDVLRRVEDQLVRASKLALLEDEDQDQIENLRRDGNAAYKIQEFDAAIDLFRRAIDVDPFDARLHFMLAMSLQHVDQTYAAVSAFERAVELEPTLYPALKNLAVLYEKKGFINKATEMWERALRHCTIAEKKEQIKLHLLKLITT